MPPDTPDYPGLVAAVAEVELVSGRPEVAASLVGPDAPVWTAPSFPRGAGLLARAAGLVAAGDDDRAAARRHLGSAIDIFTRLELPYEAARTELDLARLLHADDPDAAIGRARSAHARLELLGARHHAGEAAALLRSLGITPPPGARSTDALSAREQDVLALLAEGLSNPDIAERLFLSRRTVGHHVSSILRKLGLTLEGRGGRPCRTPRPWARSPLAGARGCVRPGCRSARVLFVVLVAAPAAPDGRKVP